jgi:hypothetical protein
MSTQPATAQIAPAVLASADGYVPPEDRPPTFSEVDGFDASAAWDRLTPDQQRKVGMLAVRWGTIGNALNYVACADDGVTLGWTPEQIALATWTPEQVEAIEPRADDCFQVLGDHLESLWPELFGWVRPRWSKPVIRQVA